ncbi:MAG: hypothetical protein IKP98_01660 [Bacilli bacterium]|nr:hypothetical protein [Bacilli bacterium]
MNYKDRIMLLIKGSKDGGTVSSEPKQKKFREKKITRLHLILVGLVVTAVLVVFVVIKVKIATKDVPYKEYEKILVNSAEVYYNVKDIEIKDGATDVVTAKELINGNFVNTDSKLVDKCDGYVESISQKDYNTGEYNITRKAYIKCGNKYKSVNYISQ